MLVEDFTDFAKALQILLERMGHVCLICDRAADALAAVDEFQPNAVIVDVGLPDTSGLELAKQIRARPDGANFVLIGCSGFAFANDRQQGLEAGMDLYFAKPVNAGELAQAVETLVQQRQLC